MSEYDVAGGGHVINAPSTPASAESSVKIFDAGAVGGTTAAVVDFDLVGCYKCLATGTPSINVLSLNVGQVGLLHILSGTPAPTVTFVGVDEWLNGEPEFVAGKLTVITLFNNGTVITGSYSPVPAVAAAVYLADLDETVAKTDIDDAGTIDGTEIAAAMSAQNVALNKLKDVLVANGLMAADEGA